MFLGLVALASLILAAVLRRPVRALLRRRFRSMWLLFAAAVLHAVLAVPAAVPILSLSPMPGMPMAGGLIYILSMCLLLVFIWVNRATLGVAVIGVGLLLNTLVIAANGGHMTVDPVLLAEKGGLEELVATTAAGEWDPYVVEAGNSRLGFLGDHFMVPRPTGRPILSVGDFFVAAGILLFFVIIPEAASRRESSPQADPALVNLP